MLLPRTVAKLNKMDARGGCKTLLGRVFFTLSGWVLIQLPYSCYRTPLRMPRLRSHSVALRPANRDAIGAHHSIPEKGENVHSGSKVHPKRTKHAFGETSANVCQQTRLRKRTSLPGTTSTSVKLSKPRSPPKPSVSKRAASKHENPDVPEKPTPRDPYSLDELEDSDDEKENIDPRGQRILGVKRKVTKRTATVTAVTTQPPKPKRSVSFSSPQPVNSRPSINVSIVSKPTQPSSSTQPFRLPLPHTPILSAAPLLTHVPSASTPAVRPVRTDLPIHNPVNPSLSLSPVNKPPRPVQTDSPEAQSPEKLLTESLVPNTSNLILEPFADDEPAKERSKSSLEDSGSRGSSTRSRKGSNSGTEDYSSWLEEFNEQLKQFDSHQLTVDEGRDS
ncbi:hypothetical protein CSKR_111984 [Clonorchis sinensis]|uniref:Uncharacterized protein n=1 Tax=Clonorchis sinensis TaxID=79923 RepID=A0A419Q3Q9_CLOSI|nr:hypothetical protein CSKR_111984 [Clonorchis sinensis]